MNAASDKFSIFTGSIIHLCDVFFSVQSRQIRRSLESLIVYKLELHELLVKYQSCIIRVLDLVPAVISPVHHRPNTSESHT